MPLRSKQTGALQITIGFILLVTVAIVLWMHLGLHVGTCERSTRLSRLAHLATGFVPYISEQIFDDDMTRGWAYAEDAARWTHETYTTAFGLECAFDGFAQAYSRRAGDKQGGEALKKIDPALYRQLYRQRDGDQDAPVAAPPPAS